MDSNFWQPMDGSGADVDMMSGQPVPIDLAEKKADKSRRLADRHRAEMLLLSELTQETEAKEIFRRLVKGVLEDMFEVFSTNETDQKTLSLVQKIRIQILIMQETITGSTVMTEATRYALMGIFEQMLHAETINQTEFPYGTERNAG